MKNNNIIPFKTWEKEHVYYLKSFSTINRSLLKDAIKNFFECRIENKNLDNNHLGVLVRVCTSQGSIKTLTTLTKINTTNEDKKYLLDIIQTSLDFKQGGYDDMMIDKIIFSFGIFKDKADINYNLTVPNFFKNVPHANYSPHKINRFFNLMEGNSLFKVMVTLFKPIFNLAILISIAFFIYLVFILIGFNGLNKIKLVFVLCVLTFGWEMFMRKESDYSLIEVNKRFISYLVIYIISITTGEIL